MKILAATCYTGGSELAAMTGRMIDQLGECVPKGVTLATSVFSQGCPHSIGAHVNYMTFHPRNVGFAFGMNAAIAQALRRESEAPDFVLCLNNDLEFPHKGWLRHLIDIVDQAPDQVLCPGTDSAAHRTQSGPKEEPSYAVQNNSAYCWLVPFEWCLWLKKTHGFWLFDEDFKPAYGEDDWTAFLLAKQFGDKAMRYVPRSFVKHLHGRTSRTVQHNRKQSSRTLIAKLQAELENPTLRATLRRWAQRYISILSTRL